MPILFEDSSNVEKLKHLTHLEDLIIDDGIKGLRQAINTLQLVRDSLQGHSNKQLSITVKADGAPSIVWGINPDNDKFFVGTKGAFGVSPKLNYTNADIDKNHPNPGLNSKLRIALKYLPELGANSVLQGDMMFTNDDLQVVDIEGISYVTFTPNTLTYAVPNDQILAEKIKMAKMGIVIHTLYQGNSFESLKASFGFNSSNLKPSKNVWFKDALFRDVSGTATLTKIETTKLSSLLSDIGLLFNKIDPASLGRLSTSENTKVLLKTYYNTHIRAGTAIPDPKSFTIGFIKWVEEKLNKEILSVKQEKSILNRQLVKQETMKILHSSTLTIELIAQIQALLVEAKLLCLAKLNAIIDLHAFTKGNDGYKVTAPEGVVVTDHLTNTTLKLVDRMTFSVNNFNQVKNWTK